MSRYQTGSNGTLMNAALLTAALLMTLSSCAQSPSVSVSDTRAIAKDAYVYGFPMVDGYRVMHAYFVDTADPEYKGPFGTLNSIPRVYTPADTAVQTPNSDTPYSMLGLDLRTEPIVLTMPAIEEDRYFSVQLVDAYTFNFDYIGSRTTGNDGGSFLVAGPGWDGEAPDGITKVIRSETNLALAIYRTQLFNPDDLDRVKEIQAGYRTEPLSAFVGQPAPAAAPAIDFIEPLSAADQKTDPEFFNILNFVLQFCPTDPSEEELMARFARIGVGAGSAIDFATMSPEHKQAMTDGMADAWQELADFESTSIATGEVTSGDMFGTREYLQNNYLYRFAAAVLGIFGNSQQEAMYPIYKVDGTGAELDASTTRYTLRFAPGQLPPVNAFWSLTMYRLPESLLVDNPIDRYLVNSPMLPDLELDDDGGLTLYVQAESPGEDREPNWLPAPSGPFMAVLRLYWPKEEALDGRWEVPVMEPVQ